MAKTHGRSPVSPRRCWFGLACLVVAYGCGSASGGRGATGTGGAGGGSSGGGAGGDAGVRQIVLVGDYAQSTVGQGYDVSAAAVTEGGDVNPNADFYLSMRMIISLFTADAPDGTFCRLDTAYQRAADIPTDATGCIWGLADLGGNGPHPQSDHAGFGYSVRDRDGARLGRLLIVRDTVGPGTASRSHSISCRTNPASTK